LESWSNYSGIIDAEKVNYARGFLSRGSEVEQMMKVVGEEGTSLDDYVIYLKGDFLDSVYFQQNSYDEVDGSVAPDRQKHSFSVILGILASQFSFTDKDEARSWFARLRQRFLDLNGVRDRDEKTGEPVARYAEMENEILSVVKERSQGLAAGTEKILA
jgi:V/A-type H+-transporting ATPase subunit A